MNRHVLQVTIALFCAGVSMSAYAQALSAASPGAFSNPTPATGQRVTDVFMGRNLVGPYVLTWRGIETGSELVSQDNRLLKRGANYNIDAGAGILTFVKPVKNGQMVRIDYRTIPGQTVRNSNTLATPMELKLFESGAMTMNAIFRPGTEKDGKTISANGPNSLMLLNVGGATQVSNHSKLASKLFFDLEGGALSRRGALQFSDETTTGLGQFKAGFTRAGREFKAAKETGIAAGKQMIDAAATLKPIGGVHASASFRQMEELPESGKGAMVTTIGQRLAGNLGAFTRFQATRTNTQTDTPNGESVSKVADRIQLDSRINASTSATALVEREEVEAGDAQKVSQTSTLSLRSQPTAGIALQGSFQNKLSPAGPEDITRLQVEANPQAGLKLSANMGDRYTRDGAFRNREAALQYDRGRLLSFSGLFRTMDDGKQQTIVRGFRASSRPLSFFEVSGGVRTRDTIVQDVVNPTLPDSYDVKVSLKLLHDALKLTGGYVDNPEDDKGVIAQARSRTVGLQSTLGRITVGGSYGFLDAYVVSKLVTTTEFSLGWKFLPASQILTAYKQLLSRDAALMDTDIYSLSLTHKLGSAFDFALSGIYTTYEKDGVFLPNKDYRAEARLGIRW